MFKFKACSAVDVYVFTVKYYVIYRETCFLYCHECAMSNWTLDLWTLWCSTSEPQRLYCEQGLLLTSYLTCILHTARISNVDIIVFLNRMRKMVSSTLSKEIKKDVFCLTMVFLYFCNVSLFIKFTFFNLLFLLSVIQRGNDRCLFMCVFLVIL